MKKAGAKNDGAWFRSNRAIMKLTTEEKVKLTNIIRGLDSVSSAFNALQSLATETGVNITGVPASKDAWVAVLMQSGIPRQVWYGHLTTTTYTNDNGTYIANYQSQMLAFAKELRSAIRKFIFADREIRDVFNIGTAAQGNPGGLPDANLAQ